MGSDDCPIGKVRGWVLPAPGAEFLMHIFGLSCRSPRHFGKPFPYGRNTTGSGSEHPGRV